MTKPAAAAEAPKQQATGSKKEAEAAGSSSAAPPAPAAAAPPPGSSSNNNNNNNNKPHSAPLPALAAAAPWLPFRVAHSKALGRHAVATRDIAAGELLLVERAVAAVPRGEHRFRACPACAAGVCGGRGRPCSPACAARAAELRERAAPALAAIEGGAAARHGLPHSCFEGLGSEDLRDLWTLVASLVAAAAIEASSACSSSSSSQEGGGEKEKEDKEGAKEENSSCGHDHGPNPESDPELDNAESRRQKNSDDPSSSVPETRWPLRCSVLRDVPFLLDGWDRYKPSWRAQATGMAKEVHAALLRAEEERTSADGAAAAKKEGEKTSGGGGQSSSSSSSFFLPSNGALSKPLDLARLSCLVAHNAHGTGAGNPASVDFGFGLFPCLAAAFNHSCLPNANFSAAGGFMRARALRDVKAGEQLAVSYVNLFEPRRTRAHQLMEAKHFVCRCPRCSGSLLEARDRFLDGVACREKGCRGGTLIPLGRDGGGVSGGGGGGGKSKSKSKKKKKKKQEAAAAAAAAISSDEAAAANKASGGGEKEEEEEETQGEGEGEKAPGIEEEEPPWTCDTCGASVRARSADGKGPADVCDAAASMWSRAAAASRAAPPPTAAANSGSKNNSRAAAVAAAAPLYEAIVALAPKTLHPHHVLVFDSLMPLCNGLRAAGDAAGAARAVGALIQAMDALVGVPSAELGNLLQLHAEILAERCSSSSNGGGGGGSSGAAAALSARLARSARESAARALEVRKTTLGPRNPLTREAEELVESLKALK